MWEDESGSVMVFVHMLSTEVRLEMRLSCTAQFWFIRILRWHECPTATVALLHAEDGGFSMCPLGSCLAMTL